MTLDEMVWWRGYTQETRFLRSCVTMVDERPTRGWSFGKKLVKDSLKHWAMRVCFTCGTAQKGMIDALLDSVGC